jgi:hypothetical protein
MKKLFLLIVCVLLLMLAFCQNNYTIPIYRNGTYYVDTTRISNPISVTGSYPSLTISGCDGSVVYAQYKYDTSLFEVKNDSLVYRVEPHLKAFRDDIPFWIGIVVIVLVACATSLFLKWWDKYKV